MDWRTVVDAAQRLLAVGDQSAAADLLEGSAAQGAADPAVYRLLATIRRLQNRTEEAVPLLKEALRLHRLTPRRVDPNPSDAKHPCASRETQLSARSIEGTEDEDLDLIEATAAELFSRRSHFEVSILDDETVHPRSGARPSSIAGATRGSLPPKQPILSEDAPTRSATNPIVSAPPAKAEVLAGCCGGPSRLAFDLDTVGEPADQTHWDVGPPLADTRAHTDRDLASLHDSSAGDEDDAPVILLLTRSGQSGSDVDWDELYVEELELDDTDDPAWVEIERMIADREKDLDLAPAVYADTLESDEDIDLGVALEPAVRSAPDFDWETLAGEAAGYDDAPTRDELVDVRTEGSITREQRALQHAIDLGREFGWDEDGIALLAEVFQRHWWSAAKESMRRELRAGLEPDELRLALELRHIWTCHPEFAIDFSRVASNDSCTAASASYRVLNWPLALSIIRSTPRYPDPESLEHMLCEQYEEWYASQALRRGIPAFNSYLYFRFTSSGREAAAWPEWSFMPDESLGLEADDDYEPGYATSDYRVLATLGLIPRVSTTCEQYEADAASAGSATRLTGARPLKDTARADRTAEPSQPDPSEQPGRRAPVRTKGAMPSSPGEQERQWPTANT